MRKSLKITLSIISGLLAVVLLVWAIVPSLPVYIVIRHKIAPEILNKTLTPAPYTDLAVPSDYVRISERGLSLSVPPDMRLKESESKSLRAYVSGDGGAIVFVNHDEDPEGFQFIGEQGYTQEEYDCLVKSIRLQKPVSNYDMYCLTLNITPQDIKLTKHGAWRPLLKLLNSKEKLWQAIGSEGYPLESEHGKGYYTRYGDPNGTRKDYRILVELFDKETGNRCAGAIISAKTLEDAVRIAASADFDPDYKPEEEAND